MSTNEKIRCTYPSCGHYFESIDAMRSHKSSADAHHYCAKCDKDFMNHALLHLHKIMSEHHFACLECELELRSAGGLRHHVKMSHPQGKEVSCLGCGCQYKSAAAVMNHIEENECPMLALPARNSQEDLFEGVIDVDGSMQPGVTSLASLLADDTSEDESDGGVPLSMDNASSVPAYGVTPSTEDQADVGTGGISRAKSNSTSTQSSGGVPLNLAGSLNRACSLLYENRLILPRVKAGSHSTNMVQRLTSTDESEQGFHDELALCLPNAHADNTVVDPEEYWVEERGQYICSCHATFLHVATFMHHVKEEDEIGLDCPRCGKRFKTHAALIAHVEAPFSKCAVRVSPDQVQQELSAMTCGFAEIQGYGQLAIEASEDIMASSQPSHPGSDETLENEPGSIQDDSIEQNAPDRSLAKGEIQEEAPDHAPEVPTDDSRDRNLAKGEIQGDAPDHAPEVPTDDSRDRILMQELRDMVIAAIESDAVKEQGS